jgi:structural maintenance of chromosome 4
MDEIDAALDFRNVSVIAHYIRNRILNLRSNNMQLHEDLDDLSRRAGHLNLHMNGDDSTSTAQFIVISLRDNMFELADSLIGIYKINQCTRSVVLEPQKLVISTN